MSAIICAEKKQGRVKQTELGERSDLSVKVSIKPRDMSRDTPLAPGIILDT